MKNLGEKGAWAYPRMAQIFRVPPIISGTGQLSYELQSITNFGKSSRGRSKDSRNFLE